MKLPAPQWLGSALLLALCFPSVARAAGDTLLPAGSIIQCTIAEPKVSSKVDQVGDPVLCQVSHSELYGRATIPYGSYLVGRFEDFKDPGHFVGKGWIELRFSRLVVNPDTIVPLDARVVSVPNYNVDLEGKIHGKGHAVKDTVEWFIPVLWPLDIINLPRRGPRVILKPETRITLKVMDDVGIPLQVAEAPQPGLQQRVPDAGYNQNYQQPAYPQNTSPAPIVQAYAQPQQQAPQTIIYNNYPAPMQQAPPPQQQQQQVVVLQAPQQPAPRYYAPPRVVYGYPPPAPYPYYYRSYP